MVAFSFALLAGLLLLFAIPVQVAFWLTGCNTLEGDLSIRWAFGLLRLQIPIRHNLRQISTFRVDDASGSNASEGSLSSISRKERKRSEKKGSRATRSSSVVFISQATVRRRVARLLRDLMHALRIREFDVHLRLGLGDPADTGRLWAWIGPLSAAIGHCRPWRITIEPDFMNAAAEFSAQGRVVFIPLQLIVLLVAFTMSPSVVHAIYSSRTGHG